MGYEFWVWNKVKTYPEEAIKKGWLIASHAHLPAGSRQSAIGSQPAISSQ